jgi:hypothetical protein
MRSLIHSLAPLIVITSCCAAMGDEPARELDTYALISDDFVARPADAPADKVFYTTNQKLLTAKLAEYGRKFPDNVDFPAGGLFVLVISDHVREAFKSLSMIDARHEVVVDLAADKDAQPPAAADKGKKTSRLLFVATAPLKTIKGFAVKAADGVQHEANSQDLKE